MRFFKRLLPVLLCASLLLSSAGCGTGEEREPAADSETEQAFETTEAQAAVPDDEVIVNFAVSPLEAGSISGVVSQTLRKGERTTEVEAVPAAGFSFVKWSDGEKNAVHRGETYSDNTTLYAMFEEADDATPVIYIDTEGGKKIRSDAADSVVHIFLLHDLLQSSIAFFRLLRRRSMICAISAGCSRRPRPGT